MKNLIQTTLFTAAILSTPLFAHAEEVTITVKGMVCSFCAQGIKKTFEKIEEVKSVEVDLDKKFVKLDLKTDSKLSNDAIEASIKDAGYEVEKIERAGK